STANGSLRRTETILAANAVNGLSTVSDSTRATRGHRRVVLVHVGWSPARAGRPGHGRSAPRARAPCSDRKSCNRSFGIWRNPDRPLSWLLHPEAWQQSEGVL